jgi:uncharacterized protein (TIGR02300 family)
MKITFFRSFLKNKFRRNKMAANASKKGLKRICMSCGTRFYDFNNRPVICPSCDTEFTGDAKPKTKRGKGAANDEKKTVKETSEKETPEKETPEKDENEEELEENEEEDIVSLEDAENLENHGDDDDESMINIDLDDDSLPDIEDDLDSDLDAEIDSPDLDVDDEDSEK